MAGAKAETRRDYYQVLGVPRDASKELIKDAFRKLALQYHPDQNPAPDAEVHFKEIAEAYAVLSDPQKRAEYDSRGFQAVAGVSAEDLFAHLDLADLFAGFGPSGGWLEHLFRRQRSARSADLQLDLVIPLERVLSGGEEVLEVARNEACDACGGTGAKPGSKPRPCTSCDGSGRRKQSQRRGSVQLTSISDCDACKGRGNFVDEPCATCSGLGRLERAHHISVRIPPGIEEGMALRLAGQGAQRDGSQLGDLYVIVHTAHHPRFARRGADLWQELTIDVTDAVLGARVEVATLEGTAHVDVPPGTRPGQVLRLRSKGLPRMDGKSRGHMYLPVEVDIPAKPKGQERRLWQQLKELRSRS